VIEQYITHPEKQNGILEERLKPRRINYHEEEGKVYMYLTKNFFLLDMQIATTHKKIGR
jgi:hypothetical protein